MKLMHLQRWDRDCGETVLWLRQNRHRFKMDVFEPPVLSVNVQDKRYADAIEACFSNNDMKVSVTLHIVRVVTAEVYLFVTPVLRHAM